MTLKQTNWGNNKNKKIKKELVTLFPVQSLTLRLMKPGSRPYNDENGTGIFVR